MKQILILSLSLLVLACQPQQSTQQTEAEKPAVAAPAKPARQFPPALTKVLDAHGSFSNWEQLGTLRYQKGEGQGAETHTIDLRDRRARIEAAAHTIGFDGQEAWISPAENEYKGSARFYHNLFFYFYAMPFVLSDPGITYEEVAALEDDGVAYPGIKVSYNDGVGDSPKDNYILYYHPETYQMTWLKYTVTFGSDESKDSYSLIHYPEWQEVGTVKLPTVLQWREYDGETIGDIRRATPFTRVEVSAARPADTLFAMPADAKVDPLPGTEAE